MFNTCPRCGTYRPDKTVDPAGPYVICPACSYRHPFRYLPLVVIGGASGTGKSTMGQSLVGRMRGFVVLEGDLLWREPFDRPQDNYRDFYETWLRLAKNISQSGDVVVLLSAGAAVAENLEPCVERRYFSSVSYGALVCQEAELRRRLEARPAWRRSRDPSFVERNLRYNAWLQEHAETSRPQIRLMDTTGVPPEVTADQARGWIARGG